MAGSSRLSGLDRLRGAALIAMALYHTTWDLHDQGLLSLDPVSHPAFMWSARIIAATFLVLSGVSLTLAHPERINWQKFWRREAQLLVAALAVSVGSYMLFPQSWIAFGILHHLAAGSLLASLLLYRSTPVLLGLALLCLFLPQLATHEALDGRWLEWIGLSAHVSPANDYVPSACGPPAPLRDRGRKTRTSPRISGSSRLAVLSDPSASVDWADQRTGGFGCS